MHSCERENEWLDEAPFYIDTSLVPRGGQRRRKSMEPKALANHNGSIVETPAKNGNTTARQCRTAPATPVNRRDSGLWQRTPEDEASFNEEDMDGDDAWDLEKVLTPVPKTPAPEAVHRFAMDVTEDMTSDEEEDDDVESVAAREELLMRTAPPKKSAFVDMGQGFLSEKKDQNVLMRLMAARRKSLQYMPKVASPLSKSWK